MKKLPMTRQEPDRRLAEQPGAMSSWPVYADTLSVVGFGQLTQEFPPILDLM